MRKLLKISFFSILFILKTLYSFPQNDFVSDLKKINGFYKETNSFSCNVSYSVYKKTGDINPYKDESGEIKKTGTKLYHRIGRIETVQNEKYVLIADRDAKIITLLPGQKSSYGDYSNSLKSLEENLSNVNVVKLKSEVNDEIYDITVKNSDIYRMILQFNKTKFYITKLTLFYKTPVDIYTGDENSNVTISKVEIKYTKYSFNKQEPDEYFTYSRFLVKNKNELVLNNEYKEFQYVNYMQNQ